MSLCSAVITYSVESDVARRELGLPSRVTFQDKPGTEAEHQFNGTLELRGQKQKACVKIMAKLKVKHIWQKDRSHSQDVIHSESSRQMIQLKICMSRSFTTACDLHRTTSRTRCAAFPSRCLQKLLVRSETNQGTASLSSCPYWILHNGAKPSGW